MNSIGFSGFWIGQSCFNAKWLKTAANQLLTNIFIQQWLTHIDISSDTNTYRIFKQNFQQSNYISKLHDRLCKILFKFRTRNHRLPVETGRWQGIPFDRRTCQECQSDLGDEFHYLFICPQLKEERKKILKELNSTVAKRGSVFIGLMTPDGAIWFTYQRAVLMR